MQKTYNAKRNPFFACIQSAVDRTLPLNDAPKVQAILDARTRRQFVKISSSPTGGRFVPDVPSSANMTKMAVFREFVPDVPDPKPKN